MENKYYQPDISEFYIGFEYESLQDERSPEEDSSWSENSIDDEWEMRTFIGYYCKDHIAGLRVKYLDKEDIESLGFEFKKEDKDGTLWFYLEDKKEEDALIMYEPYNKYLLIGYFIPFEESYIFDGNIKNKSELKLLLKQLGR